MMTVEVPPAEEFCKHGFCAQKACCTVGIAIEPAADGTPQHIRWPVCGPHLLSWTIGIINQAERLFPPETQEDPPWEDD